METRNIIIIVAVIAVIAVVGAYLFLNDQGDATATQQSTFLLSKSAYMKVPDDPNAKAEPDKKGILYYSSDKGDVNITSSSSISKSSSASEMKKIKNSIETGAKKINENGAVIYLKDGIYSVFVKNLEYGDTVLIQSPSKNVLMQCWSSLVFHDPTDVFKFDNTTNTTGSGSGTDSGNVVNGISQVESAVDYSSSSSESSSAPSTESTSTVEESVADFYSGGYDSGSQGGSDEGSSEPSIGDFYT